VEGAVNESAQFEISTMLVYGPWLVEYLKKRKGMCWLRVYFDNMHTNHFSYISSAEF
jgi:hypothetical protein